MGRGWGVWPFPARWPWRVALVQAEAPGRCLDLASALLGETFKAMFPGLLLCPPALNPLPWATLTYRAQ